MIFWTAFTLGLLGSTHCLGMCGPIAMAIPMSSSQRLKIVLEALQYNLGRILTYTLLGGVFGLLGLGVVLGGFQKSFSIVLGLLLLFAAFFSASLEYKLVHKSPLKGFFSSIKKNISRQLQKNTVFSKVTLGVFNGFLPCGLVYLAIAGAVTTGSVWNGMLFMLLFGLGTLPMMLGVMLLGSVIKPSFKNILRKTAPVIMVVFAMILIARGFNVNLPTELRFWEALQHPVMCH